MGAGREGIVSGLDFFVTFHKPFSINTEYVVPQNMEKNAQAMLQCYNMLESTCIIDLLT